MAALLLDCNGDFRIGDNRVDNCFSLMMNLLWDLPPPLKQQTLQMRNARRMRAHDLYVMVEACLVHAYRVPNTCIYIIYIYIYIYTSK